MKFALYVAIVALLGIPAHAGIRQGVLAGPPPAQLAQQTVPVPPESIPAEEDAPIIVAQDSSAQLLRIDRLENQVRGLTGQIEQMQFQQRKLEEQMRKMQEGGLAAAGSVKPAIAPVPKRPGAGDAFNPEANPGAPGIPRPLGQPYGLQQGPAPAPGNAGTAPPRQIVPQGPLTDDEGDPSKPIEIIPAPVPALPPRTVYPPSTTAPSPPPVIALPGTPTQVPLVPAPQDDYKQGLALYNQGQYAEAEAMLAGYVQKNPRGKNMADALFYLGETFFKRQRQREAAEQYLKVSTDYSKSARAPDALVRLGMALNAMGAKEQACATFGEVGRKYPDAAKAIDRAARETARAKC